MDFKTLQAEKLTACIYPSRRDMGDAAGAAAAEAIRAVLAEKEYANVIFAAMFMAKLNSLNHFFISKVASKSSKTKILTTKINSISSKIYCRF